MQAANRSLVNPPFTLAEFDRQQAARAAEAEAEAAKVVDISDHYVVSLNEPEGLSSLHIGTGLSAQAYRSIVLDRHVVAQHYQAINAERELERGVLWFDTDAVRQYARGLLMLADHVDRRNAEAERDAS